MSESALIDVARDLFALPTPLEFLTVLGMAAATYSTRALGWLVLRNRTVSARLQRALEAAPACVMASIVAPYFMTTDPVMLLSLAVMTIAALSTNLAGTVVLSVLAYAGFNAILH